MCPDLYQPHLALSFPAPQSAEEVMSFDKPKGDLDQDEDNLEMISDMDDDPSDGDVDSQKLKSIAASKDDQMQVDSEDEYDTPETWAEIDAFLNVDMTEKDESSQKTKARSVSFFCATGVKPGYVQPKYDGAATLFTLVFNDIFHVQTCLLKLLPKAHSAFK